MLQLFTSYWVHHIDPFALKFPEGLFLEKFGIEGIRWYGIAYLLGFVAAAVMLRLYYKKARSPLNTDAQTDLLTYIILGTVIGGRLGYMLLYDFAGFIANPLTLFNLQQGGMASHGGMLGIFLALLIYSRRHQIEVLKLTDILVTIGPIGLCFGRIANFINGELYGKPASVPWAIIFPNNDPLAIPRHPSQLYEAVLEGIVLTVYLQIRFWRTNSDARTRTGVLSGEFLIGYALLRTIGECFREPDAPLILNLSRGTFFSLFMLIAGIGLIVRSKRKVTAAKS